ncbi:MAG: cyclic nucleotide-binding domain-containing protein [Gammaproteobacteria bacterium]
MSEAQVDLKYLRDTPIFSSLTDEVLQKILQAPENSIEDYEAKQVIIKESTPGDCMYIILEGVVEVLISGGGETGRREMAITTLKAGDFFGEKSLLPGSSGMRNASIKTQYPTKVFKIDKKYVLMGVQRDTDRAIDDIAEEITEVAEVTDVTPVKIPKKPAKPKPKPKLKPKPKFPPDEVRDTIMGLDLFQSLNTDELKTIRDWTEVVTVGPGEFILKAAQKGEQMYIVLEGSIEIFILDDDGNPVILAKLKAGDYFGEQALMPDSRGKRNAFARTDKKSRLILIPKEYFRLVLNRDSELAQSLKLEHAKQKQARKKI